MAALSVCYIYEPYVFLGVGFPGIEVRWGCKTVQGIGTQTQSPIRAASALDYLVNTQAWQFFSLKGRIVTVVCFLFPDSNCCLFSLPCGSCSLLSDVRYTHAQLCVFVQQVLGRLAETQGELRPSSTGPWANRNLMISWCLPSSSCY